MHVRKNQRHYRGVLIGAGFIVCLILFPASRAQNGDSCFACEQANYSCSSGCSSLPSELQAGCYDRCYSGYSGCYNSCNAAYAGYHYYGDTSGYSNSERDHCFRMAHLTAYNHCFAGDPMYPDEFNSCIGLFNEGSPDAMQICCEEQEAMHVDTLGCDPF